MTLCKWLKVLLIGGLMFGGMRFSVIAQEKRIPLPNTITDVIFEKYETQLSEQWIEVHPLFLSDPVPALIIHCKGQLGAVGEWSTQTICWLDVSQGELSYESVGILTYWVYGFDSGTRTTEAQYWAIDVNHDQLDDLVILEWSFGEQGTYIVNKHGERIYTRIPYDEPTGIRIIQRKICGLAPCGVTSDMFVEWIMVIKNPGRYRQLLRTALNVCDNILWKERLTKALTQLKSETIK